MELGLALFAVIVLGGRIGVGDSDTVAVLPDGAFVALDEKAVGIGLGVIIAALILLVAADAACNFVLLRSGIVHLVFSYAGGVRICVVVIVEAGARVSVVGAVPGVTTARRRSRMRLGGGGGVDSVCR